MKVSMPLNTDYHDDQSIDVFPFCDLQSLLSSFSSSHHHPVSFDIPFTDPQLEPRPLEAMVPSKVALPSKLDLLHPSLHQFDEDPQPSVGSSPQGTQEPLTVEFSKRFRPSQESAWKASYHKLVQFRNKFGHCSVPYSYPDRNLVTWTKRQRIQYKKLMNGDSNSTMTQSRLEKLESVGFVWRAHGANWLDKLKELKDFKQRTGHCNVPSLYHENQALSTWIKSQRRQYKLY